jgi:L-aminopeptidase/D-esterase-like protein
MTGIAGCAALSLACLALTFCPARAEQDGLKPNTDITEPTLAYDWPALQIGIGSYEEGPTGLTVFRFPARATAAVDVRGGSPGTINTDALRLGYGGSFVDAIVFSGGSGYGEEAITAIAGSLKEQGVRSAVWNDVAFVPGAVIYDFTRLNEIYPDARLARAALASARSGLFPLGAQGAGRMAMQGFFFGCGAHSGQGASFHQRGELKVAAFVVVNAFGSIIDRDGRLVRCAGQDSSQGMPKVADLLSQIGNRLAPEQAPGVPSRATTLSLIMVNRQMTYAALQRLAVQVHTSMARAIQPFSTQDDGDTLFAVSTQELAPDKSRLSLLQIDAIAGEAMWDAILASVPEEPRFSPPPPVALSADRLARLAGRYRFGPDAVLEISIVDGHLAGHLVARTVGPSFFDMPSDGTVPLSAMSDTEFYSEGRYHTRISFRLGDDGKPRAAVINPGRWEQRGEALP